MEFFGSKKLFVAALVSTAVIFVVLTVSCGWPPDFIFNPENTCESSTNFSIMVGAAIGILISYLFYKVQKKQDAAQGKILDMFYSMMYPRYADAFELGKNMAIITCPSEWQISRDPALVTRERMNEYIQKIGKLCDRLGMEEITELVAESALRDNEDRPDIVRAVTESLRKTQGFSVAHMFQSGYAYMFIQTNSFRFNTGWTDWKPTDTNIEEFMSPMGSLMIDPLIMKNVKESLELWRDGVITSEKGSLYVDLVDRLISHRGERSEEAYELGHFMTEKLLTIPNFVERARDLLTRLDR